MNKIWRFEFMGNPVWLLILIVASYFFYPFSLMAVVYFVLGTVIVNDEVEMDKFSEWYEEQKNR